MKHGLRHHGTYSLCEIKSIPMKEFNKLNAQITIIDSKCSQSR